jgi:hypothetical protein
LVGLGIACIFAPAIARAQSADAYLGRVLRVRRGDVALVNLDHDGRSLSDILAAIDEWSIPPGSRVQIQLADGEHALDATISIRHPDGARISIIGNRNSPDRCRLVSERDHDMIYVGQNHVLGLIDGVTIEQVRSANRGLGTALLADEGGAILTGERIKIIGSYYGVKARRNGVVRCARITVEKGGDCNFFAFLGGHISAREASAFAASDPPNNLGSGFVAEYGGSIDCEGAQSSDNYLSGFTALSGGSIRAYRSRAFRNRFAGYLVSTGGLIVAHNSLAETNCGPGVQRDNGGMFQGSRHVDNDNMRPKANCSIR